MVERTNPYAAAPEMLRAWEAFTLLIEHSGLERSLLDLVKIRASQINACANCLNMHTASARKNGETEQRIHLLAAWQEAPCYAPRERAALAWTDHLTQISTRRAPQKVFDALAAQFSPEEQVKLTLAVNVINSWNRLALGFGLFIPDLGWGK